MIKHPDKVEQLLNEALKSLTTIVNGSKIVSSAVVSSENRKRETTGCFGYFVERFWI